MNGRKKEGQRTNLNCLNRIHFHITGLTAASLIISKLFSLTLLLLFSFQCLGQYDLFTGTWHMQIEPEGKRLPIEIEIKIASPEKKLLYPAQMKLSCDSFSAVYDLLLVKRNSRQLGIGRQKIPVSEAPFSLGNWTVFLNGTLDYSKDLKGFPVLTASRITTRQYNVTMPDIKTFESRYQRIALQCKDLLKDAEIQLNKTVPTAWESPHADSILRSPTFGKYFGMIDTIHTFSKECTLDLVGNKKNANGIVSVLVNGYPSIDLADLSYKKTSDEIILDTGLNILIFFADGYGKSASTTGKLDLKLDKRNIHLNFNDQKDLAATFIVARIYYYPHMEERSLAENELNKLPPEFRTWNEENVFYYPPGKTKAASQTPPFGRTNEEALQRDSKVLGNIVANSRQITLAIWDDAVEDGDSISLSINGRWIAQGLAVKKRPQFIIVTIEPGQNKITFIADNLGSIPPNTSVLEIIDGKKRNAFMIDTNLRQNNLVNIMYDSKPSN